MPPSVGILVDMASGVLFAALAVLVWRLGTSHAANRTFAAFAGVFAAFLVVGNLIFLFDPAQRRLRLTLAVVSAPLAVATVALMVRLARYLPWPTTEADRASGGRIRFVPSLVLGLFILLQLWGIALAEGATPDPPVPLIITYSSFAAVAAGVGYLAAWMPIRYGQAEADRERQQAALLGVALALFPAMFAGAYLGDPRTSAITVLAAVVMVGTLAGLWLSVTRGPGARRARWAALLVLGIALASQVAGAAWGVSRTLNSGLMGLARAVTVLVIAYGVLRHQLLGIDVTVKRGVRRSTLAAIFVAAFFVASEGAQVLFADFAGSEIVGVLAAGLLVFFLAPLQRFADRVSDQAMPGVEDSPEYRAERKREIYRAQLEELHADGEVTAKERRMLGRLQEELGLGGDEAARLEADVLEGGGEAA